MILCAFENRLRAGLV